ncbi:hypothetical protein FHETE_7349 [Fusarium heterosporum]|uniref:Uncharacterized protein n=1 Tax=Fusarium heterosporum TaxID=42747 RepID=A0A8H5T6W9_FUSHE|nr:hypothetical protein FHETE_7349 [Fusarium heterosporum]
MSGREMARQPFWLSKTALVVFLLIFIACATCLIALDRAITSRKGLPLTISSSSYSWTYGPTAVLIVLLSLWRRVDYYYKLREPWRQLQSGPSAADDSLLLDYITTFQVTSIVQALKRRHYAVAATITAFFLLKFIILISTTLFVVKEISAEGSLNVTMQDTFDAAPVWPTYEAFIFGVRESEQQSLIFSGGSDSSIWKYLSRLNNVTTHDTSWGLSDDLATQRFAFTTGTSNVTRLERPVDIFVPKVSCEDATISESESIQYKSPEIRNFTFTSKTCANGGIMVQPCLGDRYADTPLPNDTYSPCQPNPHVYGSYRVNCSHGLERQYWDIAAPVHTWPKDIEPFDIRYAISVADFKSGITHYNDSRITPNVTSMKLLRSAAVICKIGYGIATANATMDLLTGNVSIAKYGLDDKLRTLHNLSNVALAEMLWANLANPSNFLVVDEKVPTRKPPSSSSADVLFQLMYAQLGRPDNLDPFYNTLRLKNATVSVFEGIAREFARQSLLDPKPLSESAKGWVAENRLHTRHVALWIMVAGFCLLAVICLLLLLIPVKFNWVPAMSGSLAGSAAILADSPNVQAVLAGSGHLGLKALRKKLAGIRFSATKGSNEDYEVHADSSVEPLHPVSSVKSQVKETTWVPLPVRLPVIAATFAAPIIAIGVLEFLYHILRSEGNFVHIDGDTATISYLIRIASTLVVFGIATMINNLDSTIVVFAPYSNLRSGSASADRSILFHLLSVNPFLVMFKSLRHHQFGPAASYGATLITGFLTIIVSGLWIPVNSLVVNQPSAADVNNWDRTWLSNATSDGGAAVALNLIQFGGASTPVGIWKDVVLPSIFLPADSAKSPRFQRGANYTYDVLALEPFLKCTVMPESVITVENMTYPMEAGQMDQWVSAIGMSIQVQPPGIDRRCSDSSIKGFANLTFGMKLSDLNPQWIGKYFDLPQSTAGQVSADCPSIGMIFGNVMMDKDIDRNLTAVLCSQGIRQVPIRVTYNGNPALGKIGSIHTQGEYASLQNKTSGAYTFGFKLEGFLNANLLAIPASGSEQTYDSFFSHLLLRSKGYSRDKLAGRKNVDKFVQAVTKDYNEYLRHVIDRNFRAGNQSPRGNILSAIPHSSAHSLSPHSMITGKYSAEVTHLVVDWKSKLILQVLFAIMTVLSFIGFCLVRIRGTLPRDPCSIGSTMSLLADSQICEKGSGIVPEAAQYMSESQLRRTFDGWVFSLGWWGSGSSVAPSLNSEVASSSDTVLKSIRGMAITAVHGEKRFGVDIGKANS